MISRFFQISVIALGLTIASASTSEAQISLRYTFDDPVLNSAFVMEEFDANFFGPFYFLIRDRASGDIILFGDRQLGFGTVLQPACASGQALLATYRLNGLAIMRRYECEPALFDTRVIVDLSPLGLSSTEPATKSCTIICP